MKRQCTLLVLVVAGGACVPAENSPLYDSRVALEPLLGALSKSGGDVSKILRPQSAGDLAALESGKRYKFVVLASGGMAIAPLPADTTGNEYVHPVLAGGAAVLTAGGLTVTSSDGAVSKVVLDQDSKAYCPGVDSLRAGASAVVRLGVAADKIRVDNRPPECAGAALHNAPVSAPAPRYGALMVEIGHRFEVLGRAIKASRLELAAFEHHEIEEAFEEDLPRARPPSRSAGVDLRGMADTFVATAMKGLHEALENRDSTATREAYAAAAEACNACHRVSGHGFVEIAGQPGREVPALDGRP